MWGRAGHPPLPLSQPLGPSLIGVGRGVGEGRALALSPLPNIFYSTVTLLARLRGWSTSVPLRSAIW